MTLKGVKVRHKTLGVGVIEDDSSKLIITVCFHNAPGGEKHSNFMMPNAFVWGFLSAYDEDSQDKINEFIRGITCSICGAVNTEIECISGKYLCKQCKDEHTEICSCCGERYLVDGETEKPLYDLNHNRLRLCPKCFPLETFVCKKCGRTHHRSYLVNEKYAPKSSLLCKYCAKKCNVCGARLDDKHAHYFGTEIRRYTNFYCPDCWPDRKQYLEMGVPIRNQPAPENEPKHVANGDTLYIYKGQIICRKDNHVVIAATGILHDKFGHQIKLDIQYCTQCKRYLLEYMSYKRYQKRYGLLVGNIRMMGSGTFDGDTDMAQESPLRLCGYSVGQDRDLSESTRHYLLAKMIHDNIMTKAEVIRYLEHFINMNGMKYGNELALEKWENDLDFVHEYKIDTQPEVYIDSIEKY